MAGHRRRKQYAQRQRQPPPAHTAAAKKNRGKREPAVQPTLVPPFNPLQGGRPTPDQVLQLQRTLGNRRVRRYLGRIDQSSGGRAAAGLSPNRPPAAGSRSGAHLQRAAPAKKESVAATLARLRHPTIRYLVTTLASMKQARAAADAPLLPLKTKKQRAMWKVRRFKRRKDPTPYEAYKETRTSTSKWLVQVIERVRVAIDRLQAAELKISQGQLEKIQAYFHRQLNTVSPYFTQMANMNILWLGSKRGNQAWKRTCNLTSLAMTLQALGVTTDHYAGDKAMLLRIAQQFDPAFKRFSDLEALRMPDFLQFVVIYLQLPKVSDKHFRRRVMKARAMAAPLLSTTLPFFEHVAREFNVLRVHMAHIESTGKRRRDGKKGTVATATYKREVRKKLEPWLNQGAQVVVNKPWHYVRLEEINDRGIVIDDPSKKGKNFPVRWAAANRAGYFRTYMVFA